MTPSNSVTANGLNIYHEEAGSGEPLFLLHGAMGSSANWQPTIPHLASFSRVIAPDLRDHGRTPFTPDPDPTHLAEQVTEDIVGLMDALALERAALCGWSGGGDTALRVACRYPDRVRALIVGGVTHRITDAARATLAAMGLDGPGQVNLARAHKAIPDLIALWQRTHTQFPDHWLRLLERQSHLMLNPPLLTVADLATIDAPTLIIWGDRDQFLPVEQAVAVYRMLPNARLAVIPNADHFVTRTHEAQFHQIVADFLATLPSNGEK
ncbi:MAG: alpha/beta fold hydrolase [Anaerolineae bacterium]